MVYSFREFPLINLFANLKSIKYRFWYQGKLEKPQPTLRKKACFPLDTSSSCYPFWSSPQAMLSPFAEAVASAGDWGQHTPGHSSSELHVSAPGPLAPALAEVSPSLLLQWGPLPFFSSHPALVSPFAWSLPPPLVYVALKWTMYLC